MVDDEADRELDERHARLVGDRCELLDGFELALVSGSDMSKRAASRWRAGEVGELSALQLPESQPPASGL